jgi:hypothetical protein
MSVSHGRDCSAYASYLEGHTIKPALGDLMSWDVCGFPLSVQSNAETVSQIRPRPLPFICFTIDYSLIMGLQSKIEQKNN